MNLFLNAQDFRETQTPGNRMAFTLVEMLVIILIISILAAMLVPALSKSICIAKDLSCIGNMRGVSVGVHSYLQDFNGFMPYKDANAGELYSHATDTYQGQAKLKQLHYLVDGRIFWCGYEDAPKKLYSSGHKLRGSTNFSIAPPPETIVVNVWYRYAVSSSSGYQDKPTENITQIDKPGQTGLFMCASTPSNNAATSREELHGGRGFSLGLVDSSVVFYDYKAHTPIDLWVGSSPYKGQYPEKALNNATKYYSW